MCVVSHWSFFRDLLTCPMTWITLVLLCCVYFGRDGVDVVGIFEFQCLVRTMILYNLSILHLKLLFTIAMVLTN